MMINQHIIHLGLPHTGTTFLWKQLDVKIRKNMKDKELSFLINDDLTLDAYQKYFKKFDISANFNPAQYGHDTGVIKHIHSLASHISISFRNPYEILESALCRNENDGEHVECLIFNWGLDKFTEIVQRWEPLKIMIYDDLIANPMQYVDDYLSFINQPAKKISVDPINQRPHTTIPMIDSSVNNSLNASIKKFSKYIGRDFSHWLR